MSALSFKRPVTSLIRRRFVKHIVGDCQNPKCQSVCGGESYDDQTAWQQPLCRYAILCHLCHYVLLRFYSSGGWWKLNLTLGKVIRWTEPWKNGGPSQLFELKALVDRRSLLLSNRHRRNHGQVRQSVKKVIRPMPDRHRPMPYRHRIVMVTPEFVMCSSWIHSRSSRVGCSKTETHRAAHRFHVICAIFFNCMVLVLRIYILSLIYILLRSWGMVEGAMELCWW